MAAFLFIKYQLLAYSKYFRHHNFIRRVIEKINIDRFINLSNQLPVLDARSPGEYNHAHIPGAYSFPLFSDEERKIVGTAYKQKSREEAIKIGLDFFGVKMRKMVESAENILSEHNKGENNRTVLIHCWRGGMRSTAIAWLLDLYGFKVHTLAGGYKSFRNWVLEQFNIKYNFKILGGYTGSGKTPLLQELVNKNIAVIDLEKLANHKGSAFGAIGEQPQPGQEMFENKLAVELSNKSKNISPIWMEDESQRIGGMMIPKSIWEQMRISPVYFLEIPFEERLQYLVTTYGSYKNDELVNAIMRIQKRLGGLETKNAINYILENNKLESFRILLQYYDKLYTKGLNNRPQVTEQLIKINCNTVSPLNYEKLGY